MMGPTHGKTGINILRWLKRSVKNARDRSSSDDERGAYSDGDFASQGMLSPPPLTEASGSTEDSSVILTPKPTFGGLPPPATKQSRARRRSDHAPAPFQVHSPTPVRNRVRTPHTPALGPIPLPTSPNPPPAISSHRRHTQSLPSNSLRPVPAPYVNPPPVALRAPSSRPLVATTAVVLAKPVPLKAQAAITINAILAYDPKQAKLLYDLTLPSKFVLCYPQLPHPSTVVKKNRRLAQSYTPLQPPPDTILNAYATEPPVSKLRIIAEQFSYFNWEIIVKPCGRDPHPFVRVSDVLACLHVSLRTQVTRDEYDTSPENFKKQLKKAYKRRCALWGQRMSRDSEDERKGGVRRIDFLLDMTRFVGLERKDEGLANTISREVTTWVLKVDEYIE